MDLTAGDALVWRRLEAYAETMLTPDPATSSRLRARVLAVAHRQAALARADAALTVLPEPAGAAVAPTFAPRAQQRARNQGGRRGWGAKRVAAVLLAASLGVGLTAGGAYAARPAGPLYQTLLWAETLMLPSDPSARAVAELARLQDRLREIAVASRAGDAAGATAALEAYQAIVDEASAAAIAAGDDVAAAVLETGVGNNVEVLQALIAQVPAHASAAISLAVDAAIVRSTAALERIHASQSGEPGYDPAAGIPTAEPTPHPTRSPADKPTAEPTLRPTPKPKPTAEPTAEAIPGPTAEPTVEPTPVITPTPAPSTTPEKTQKPRDTGGPPGGGPPGQQGRETQTNGGG